MTLLDSVLKSRGIILSTKVRIGNAMDFPVVMHGCECWTIKKCEHWRIDAFELWCWRRPLRVLWTARRTNSVQFSRSVVSDSLWTHELQHARPPCPSPTARVHSNSCPSSQWCHPAISSSVIPSPPAFNLSQHQGPFQWVSSLHQVAKGLEFQLQHQSFQWIFRTDYL